MKQCTLCRESKPLDEYVKKSTARDGLGHWCRPCRKAKKREGYEKHRSKYLKRASRQRQEDPEQVAAIKRQCYLNKRDQYLERDKAHYQANRELILEKCRVYREKNRKKIKARNRDYNHRNRARKLEYQSRYYEENKKARLEYATRYVRHRLDTDPMYRLAHTTRRRVTLAIAKGGYTKRSRTHEILGCDFATLAQHLEAQFQSGMSWQNRGEWHIDHITPLASAETEDELLALCHYTNLQPLWAFDNLSKGAKLPDEVRP